MLVEDYMYILLGTFGAFIGVDKCNILILILCLVVIALAVTDLGINKRR